MSLPTLLTLALLAALPGAPSRASAAERAMAEHAEAASGPDQLVVVVLLIGLAGVAAVVMIGTGMMLARRDRAKEPPLTAMAQAAAALERRSVRRSKVRLTDDPIVAGLGIDAAERRRPRHRARARRETDGQRGMPLT
jgi:hypothetical protein